MPRVLILQASLGSGHLSAANALAEALQRLGAEARVEDVLAYASSVLRVGLPRLSFQINEYGPQLYRVLYERSNDIEITTAFRQNRLIGLLTQPFLTQLDRLIDETRPDAVVAAHPIAGYILTLRKQQGRLEVPFYVVVTDFLAHSSWLVSGVRRYFLPSDFTRWALARRGLPARLLEVTGIPINLEIADPKPATAMRARHGLPAVGPVITLFGGGIEARRVRLIAEELLASEVSGTLVSVAGRNLELAAALSDLGDGPQMAMRRLGRIDFVDDLVAASDVVITKAGGLIISEVLARRTPLVIIDPLLGQEEWNADFITGVGAGVQLRMPEMAARTALALLQQPGRMAAMREQAARVGFPEAASTIARRILGDLVAHAT